MPTTDDSRNGEKGLDFSTVKIALMGPGDWKGRYLRGDFQRGSLLAGCVDVQIQV